VLILAGDHLYRMNYQRMLEDHVATGAGVTVGVQPCSKAEIGNFGAVRVDKTGRIVEFREKPKTAKALKGMEASKGLLQKAGFAADRPYLASMGIYLFDKELLRQALDNDLIDFGHHVIPACVDTSRVQAHFFGGYWQDIGTIRSFYEAHMDMVSANPQFDFFDPDWQFYTHPRYLPGSRLSGCRFHESILAGGADLQDCTIEKSIIGVRASMRRATVKRSLIMGTEDFPPPAAASAPPVGVGEGSLIQDAIIDLNARIGRNVRIVNKQGLQEDEGRSWVIRDGIVVIPKNAIIPDDTVN
jgi:glucose-1-phosphate adenylyltransferase